MKRSMKRRLLAAGALSCVPLMSAALGGCGGASAGPVVPGGGEKIVFVSTRPNPEGTPSGIWIMNPDGSEQRFLASGGGPKWSPDRTKIAFTANVSNNVDIYVMDASGNNKNRVTSATSIEFDPAWSPDGKQIVYASRRNDDADLYIADIDGSDERRLTDLPRAQFKPVWSPTGTHIAFESGANPNDTGPVPPLIYVINVDGTNLKSIGRAGSSEPDWHPAGQSLIYSYFGDLYTANFDGTNEQLVIANFSDPVYSPDGRRIAAVGRGTNVNEGDIFVFNVAGPNPVNITNNPDGDEAPDWR